MVKKVRHPCVAGFFYDSNPEGLRRQINGCFTSPLGPGRLPKLNPQGPRVVKGMVVPHAGYMYSGPVAAYAYLNLASDGNVDTVVIIGPNHTGAGTGISIMVEGVWRTPIGEVEVDEEVANSIWRTSKLIAIDEEAHVGEHSIEVQLPFLIYTYGPRFKIVPICMMLQEFEASLDTGLSIAKAIKGRNVVVLASTDFTHYEPHTVAKDKDEKAIRAIIELDAKKLMETVREYDITMCGYGPVGAMLIAAKELGATRADLLKYATSGDVTGDRRQVVGYASISVY
ncbi:MAG: AmmeMemoRadiSam system protein B [Candidatus Nezhaarchaeales archaeon]